MEIYRLGALIESTHPSIYTSIPFDQRQGALWFVTFCFFVFWWGLEYHERTHNDTKRIFQLHVEKHLQGSNLCPWCEQSTALTTEPLYHRIWVSKCWNGLQHPWSIWAGYVKNQWKTVWVLLFLPFLTKKFAQWYLKRKKKVCCDHRYY